MVPASGSPSSCSLLLPLEPKMASVALAWDQTWGKNLLWQSSSFHPMPQRHLASLMGSGLFCIPPVAAVWLLQAISDAANPSPVPMSDLQSPNFGIQQPLPTALVDKCLRLGCAGSWYQSAVQVTLCPAFLRPVAAFSSKAPYLPLHLSWSPYSEGTSLGVGNIQLPSELQVLSWFPYSFFSLINILSFLHIWRFPCPFSSLKSSTSVQ